MGEEDTIFLKELLGVPPVSTLKKKKKIDVILTSEDLGLIADLLQVMAMYHALEILRDEQKQGLTRCALNQS